MYHNAPNDREYQFISLIGFPPLKWPLEGEGKRFVTRTTFQGDGLGPAVGIWADESVYVESAPPSLRVALTSPLAEPRPSMWQTGLCDQFHWNLTMFASCLWRAKIA